MGYGDITPMHPIARSLAVMQALAGQLYEEESRAYVQIYLDWLRRSLAPG